MNIEDTEANELAHLTEFDVDAQGRFAARLLGLTDSREIVALAAAVVAAG